MFDYAPTRTPMVAEKAFSALDGKPMTDPSLYRPAIGSLQYLITTRLDIAYAVNKLSQYLSKPTEIHFHVVNRIFRYIKDT